MPGMVQVIDLTDEAEEEAVEYVGSAPIVMPPLKERQLALAAANKEKHHKFYDRLRRYTSMRFTFAPKAG